MNNDTVTAASALPDPVPEPALPNPGPAPDPAPDPAPTPSGETFRLQVQRELEEIQRHDPSVHSVADILRLPCAPAFQQLVRSGKTFLEAYRLANFDNILSQAAKAARQQALNEVCSKSHLSATVPRGAGAPPLPAGELSLFRALLPDTPESEMQSYYAQYQKGV